MRLLGLIIVAAAMVGCASTKPVHTASQPGTRVAEAPPQIDLSNGVDRATAQILADRYFHKYISGCGMTGRAFESRNYWEIEVLIGIAAMPSSDPIRIDKKTGWIYWNAQGPIIYDYKTMWRN